MHQQTDEDMQWPAEYLAPWSAFEVGGLACVGVGMLCTGVAFIPAAWRRESFAVAGWEMLAGCGIFILLESLWTYVSRNGLRKLLPFLELRLWRILRIVAAVLVGSTSIAFVVVVFLCDFHRPEPADYADRLMRNYLISAAAVFWAWVVLWKPSAERNELLSRLPDLGRPPPAAASLAEGPVPVKMLNGKWGYVVQMADGRLRTAILGRFEEADRFSEGLAAVAVRNTDRTLHSDNIWGYINRDGAFVIHPRFFDAGKFRRGIAVVRLRGCWGSPLDPHGYNDMRVIDKTGEYTNVDSEGRNVTPSDFRLR